MTVKDVTGRIVGEVIPNPPAYKGFRSGPYSPTAKRSKLTIFCLKEADARHELMAWDLERVA